MISVPPGTRIVVATQPVDFRAGMDSLAALIQQKLRPDPFCGNVFVFRSKRMDRVKIVVWDGTGLCLFMKRLELGNFTWPPIREGVMALTAAQLAMLLEGLDWSRVRPVSVKRPAALC